MLKRAAETEGENEKLLDQAPPHVRELTGKKVLMRELGRMAGHADVTVPDLFVVGSKVTGKIETTNGIFERVRPGAGENLSSPAVEEDWKERVGPPSFMKAEDREEMWREWTKLLVSCRLDDGVVRPPLAREVEKPAARPTWGFGVIQGEGGDRRIRPCFDWRHYNLYSDGEELLRLLGTRAVVELAALLMRASEMPRPPILMTKRDVNVGIEKERARMKADEEKSVVVT